MGERIRAYAWAATTLGSPEDWPQALKTVFSIMLHANQPMFTVWGSEQILLYNGRYAEILLQKHPAALGRPFLDVWHEIAEDLRPIVELAYAGEPTHMDDIYLVMQRRGYPEETHFSFSYTPIRGEGGEVCGFFCPCDEITDHVLSTRRTHVLSRVAAGLTGAGSQEDVLTRAAEALAAAPEDLPFVLFYLPEVGTARLAASAGLASGAQAAPGIIEFERDNEASWPLHDVLRSGRAVKIEDLKGRFGTIQCGPYPEPPTEALALPITSPGREEPAAVLIAALSPRLKLDESYWSFLSFLASTISSALTNAVAFAQERARSRALAEIDRAKNEFFSNVSHELRTPLTLMLAPTEEALASPQRALSGADLAIVHRSSRRLLKLVNSLLDFARIEAGRFDVNYQPTDLARLTADLASVFRSAVEKAGLAMVVDCPPLDQEVYVDRDLWEKIVLNLLSNALKYTFEGEIAVILRQQDGYAELTVRDSGTGIPESELPRLFERFHRIKDARARSQEGTGIGLALVQELVKLHKGSIEVESSMGVGTTFRVRIPLDKKHPSPDRIGASIQSRRAADGAAPFVEEALRWVPASPADALPQAQVVPEGTIPFLRRRGERGEPARVLVADDNADMLDYLRQLLGRYWEVEIVADGTTALANATRNPPDLILADVMMPGLDGFELVHRLRSDPATREIPIVLLSARAGEEERLGGIASGADDYIVKPFLARELLARIGALLELSRIRREAARQVRVSNDRLATAVAIARLGVWEYDADAATTSFDQRAKEIFGLTADRPFSSEEVFALVHKDDLPRVREDVRRVLEKDGDGVYESEYRIVRSDGMVRWVVVRGHATRAGGRAGEDKTVQFVGTLMDVTERKQVEMAHRESEERFRALVMASSEVLYRMSPDWREMRQLYSQGFLLQTKEPDRAWMQKYIHSDDQPQVIATIHEAIRTKSTFVMEHRVLRADGTLGWTSSRAVPLLDEDGEIFEWFGAASDITERKAAELKLIEAMAAAEEASRAKSEFLANMSHEIRTPMTVFMAAVEHLLQIDRNPERRKLLSMAHQSAARLRTLIDDILDFSRIEARKVELEEVSFELRGCVHEAVEMFSLPAREKGLRLDAEIAAETPKTVVADPDRLGQVLINIVGNAVKFTHQGHVRVLVKPRGRFLEFSVEDTGIGIAEEKLDLLFQSFTQVDSSFTRKYQGTGLGLAISKGLVELMGGEISVRSRKGEGSVFTFTLPLKTVKARPPSPAEARPEDTGERPVTARILLAEDDPMIREMITMMLARKGMEVATAETGREAFDRWTEGFFDLILMDLQMPEMNGLEATRRIRQQEDEGKKRTCIIGLTAHARREIKEECLSAGMDRVVTKPVQMKDLLAAIEECTSRILSEEDFRPMVLRMQRRKRFEHGEP